MSTFVRIGDKLLDPERIHQRIHEILDLRSKGLSQQEVADRLGVDRPFISRLETLGEVRRGGTLALIALPVANKEEIKAIAVEEGVDFSVIMDNEERWAFVKGRNGAQLINDLMKIIADVKSYDRVIMLGSDERIRFVRALLGKEAISMELGKSPLVNDVYVEPTRLRQLIKEIKSQTYKVKDEVQP